VRAELWPPTSPSSGWGLQRAAASMTFVAAWSIASGSAPCSGHEPQRRHGQVPYPTSPTRLRGVGQQGGLHPFLTSGGCATAFEIAHSPAGFDRRATSRPVCSVRCRFHTCLPVYRGFARITAAVRNVHIPPRRCRFRSGSTSDGHGAPRSFSSRAIPATLHPARRCSNIHRTCGAVTGSGSSRPQLNPRPQASNAARRRLPGRGQIPTAIERRGFSPVVSRSNAA
jgi:hypothetical protein